jgi:hypothetical protein
LFAHHPAPKNSSLRFEFFDPPSRGGWKFSECGSLHHAFEGDMMRGITGNSAPRGIGFLAAALSLLGASSTAQAEVLISNGTATNIACVSGVCTPTKKTAILSVTQLESLLAAGNVTVTTDGSLSANIVVNSALNWASSHSLTLDAYQSITVNKRVAVNGTGGLTLTTDDGGTGGMLSFGEKGRVSFLSTANSLTINGAAYTLVADTTTLASDIAAKPSGDFALASDYNAAGHSSFVSSVFTGKFEGLGNSISHLSLTANEDDFGLFTQLGSGGAITNVRLTQASVLGGVAQLVGVLVGLNKGLLAGDSVGGHLKAVTGPNGGLAGGNQGTIVSCYSTVEGTANDKRGGVSFGGLVGYNELGGTIDSSFATGSISSAGNDTDGGLVGSNAGAVSNSYATGSVTDTSVVFAGGLAGANPGGTIADSFSTGTVRGASGSTIGGLVGTDSTTSRDITTSYWDTTTSGVSQGAGNINNDPGIAGLTTPQLQAGLPTGFSSTIWDENSAINGGQPYLLALPPPA